MAITSAVSDLLSSIRELLASVFGTAYAVIHSFVASILGLFTGFFAFLGDLGKGVFDVAGGVGKFVAGNAAIIAVLGAAYFAYGRFVKQPQQGRKPAVVNGAGAGKKTN